MQNPPVHITNFVSQTKIFEGLILDLVFFDFCEAVPWLLQKLFRIMLCGTWSKQSLPYLCPYSTQNHE
jgi:hypothetical protein